MTKQYVGTLRATATPMTRAAYNVLRGWTLPADENGEDAGYHVVNSDTQHQSWLPHAVFHHIYKEAQ